MSSQLIRSPKVLLLLQKQYLRSVIALNQLQGNRQYYGKAKIGKREVVGFGGNGVYAYFDMPDVPMPAIRFREEDSEITKLREKEKGNWKDLTIDEKKKCIKSLLFFQLNYIYFN